MSGLAPCLRNNLLISIRCRLRRALCKRCFSLKVLRVYRSPEVQEEADDFHTLHSDGVVLQCLPVVGVLYYCTVAI